MPDKLLKIKVAGTVVVGEGHGQHALLSITALSASKYCMFERQVEDPGRSSILAAALFHPRLGPSPSESHSFLTCAAVTEIRAIIFSNVDRTKSA